MPKTAQQDLKVELEAAKAHNAELEAARDSPADEFRATLRRLRELITRHPIIPPVSVDDDERAAAELTLSLLAALVRSDPRTGAGDIMSSSLSDDRISITIKPSDIADILQGLDRNPFAEWISQPVRKLWSEGDPVEFKISINAVVDKRKRSRMEKRLDKEASEKEQQEEDDRYYVGHPEEE
jgi:hypothetical protein